MSAQPVARASVRAVDAIDAYFAEARAPRKDSAHTTRAYRNDLGALLAVIARQLGVEPGALTVMDLAPLPVMRRAFGVWAADRAARSVRRAHSTWSGYFEYLVSEELVPGSPMPGVPKPKLPRSQPKPFAAEATRRLVSTVRAGDMPRQDPWPELDQAIVLTALVTGLRTAELLGLSIGDVNRTPGSEALRVLGKGRVWRTVPVEPRLLDVHAAYLETRRARFPATARKRGVAEGASAWDWWDPGAPLLVDRRGERMREGALRYLIGLAYRAAGIEPERVAGALTHAMRHTAATRAAESGTPVVELMRLFGWSTLNTPQAYVDATAREIRRAAQTLYAQLDSEE